MSVYILTALGKGQVTHGVAKVRTVDPNEDRRGPSRGPVLLPIGTECPDDP